ncbi:MAG: hypothetical protein K2G28_10230 [Acetatifactor sp.]|nr:hypothetical protein [Acetatifactor sp.]MDE7351963.1 hypothetical protein [Acetatifactor sp.]
MEDIRSSIIQQVIRKLQGRADSTLQRYADINSALLNYLGKSLGEITTYDIRFYLSARRQLGESATGRLTG